MTDTAQCKLVDGVWVPIEGEKTVSVTLTTRQADMVADLLCFVTCPMDFGYTAIIVYNTNDDCYYIPSTNTRQQAEEVISKLTDAIPLAEFNENKTFVPIGELK